MSGYTDFLYNNARHLFATAQLNWPTAAVNAMLVSASYSPSLNDVYVSDIPSSAIIVRDLLCTSVGEKNGACYCTIPQIQAVVSPYTVVAVVLYIKGASDSVSPLVYYSSTGPGFPFLLQGFSYYVGYDVASGGFFQV
ncbi:MAG TPA: hypothetical protein VN734_17115 [Acidobacteriaceae bacterium]|nr:hypothetical protein [Acidobacteriaceae bacterium]